MPIRAVPPAVETLRRVSQRVAAVALIALAAACATRTPAPVVERTPAPKPAAVAAPAPAAPAAETDWRPKTYTVKRGDTLHQIALDYGLDYRELAAWNNIENPNLIRVGQALRLSAPGEPPGAAAAPGVTITPLKPAAPVVAGDARSPAPAPAGPRNADNYKSQPKVVKEPYSDQAVRDVQRAAAAAPPPVEAAPAASGSGAAPAPAPGVAAPVGATGGAAVAAGAAGAAGGSAAAAPARPAATPAPAAGDDEDKIDWLWPATGKLVTGFSDTANLKGIDIAGKAGQPVLASAAGKVVYAGSGLRGYGKLVIVKHNNTYLSAYAHNSEILVKEGQQVTRGQKIAEMGNSDSDQVKLHFEIRRLGKPVDPLKYLPPT
jgi:lipoprotein NlpD